MSAQITPDIYPSIHKAMGEIECDNGAHLIGTVYPGEPCNFDVFTLPDGLEPLIADAEKGLARLRADSEDDFNTFLVGEEDEVNAIRTALAAAPKPVRFQWTWREYALIAMWVWVTCDAIARLAE
jgi:hypothetical protein